MTALLKPFANLIGRGMAQYAFASVRPSRAYIEGKHHLPDGPAIYLGWHGANLLAMGLLRAFGPRTCCSIVPTGLTGATIRGFLHGIGNVEPISLDESRTGNLRGALRKLSAALEEGKDVVIAGDGPSGPGFQLRPGAAWLARMSGYPIVTIGYAAWPAVRIPRWDRHIVPLPGARVSAVVAPPLRLSPSQKVDAALQRTLEARLNSVTAQARDFARPRPGRRQIGTYESKEFDD
jgi:lysophospholipid acyltransferase (LPLAT)-like uncharacterized protein